MPSNKMHEGTERIRILNLRLYKCCGITCIAHENTMQYKFMKLTPPVWWQGIGGTSNSNPMHFGLL
jgi:hypothetical protein